MKRIISIRPSSCSASEHLFQDTGQLLSFCLFTQTHSSRCSGMKTSGVSHPCFRRTLLQVCLYHCWFHGLLVLFMARSFGQYSTIVALPSRTDGNSRVRSADHFLFQSSTCPSPTAFTPIDSPDMDPRRSPRVTRSLGMSRKRLESA